jgi:hypothetical protein
MRTAEQANATQEALAAQLLAAQLTEPMRHALLAAQGTVNRDDLNGDTVADYCPGHEVLRGDYMGRSFYCEGTRVCKQAVDAYRAERTPDHDVLHVRKSDTVKVGTVCALIDRRLLENAPTFDEFGTPQHVLTDKGMATYQVLKSRQESGEIDPAASYTRHDRARAGAALQAARAAFDRANEASRTPQAFAEGLAATLDSLALAGNMDPETLRATARAMRDI